MDRNRRRGWGWWWWRRRRDWSGANAGRGRTERRRRAGGGGGRGGDISSSDGGVLRAGGGRGACLLVLSSTRAAVRASGSTLKGALHKSSEEGLERQCTLKGDLHKSSPFVSTPPHPPLSPPPPRPPAPISPSSPARPSPFLAVFRIAPIPCTNTPSHRKRAGIAATLIPVPPHRYPAAAAAATTSQFFLQQISLIQGEICLKASPFLLHSRICSGDIYRGRNMPQGIARVLSCMLVYFIVRCFLLHTYNIPMYSGDTFPGSLCMAYIY